MMSADVFTFLNIIVAKSQSRQGEHQHITGASAILNERDRKITLECAVKRRMLNRTMHLDIIILRFIVLWLSMVKMPHGIKPY